MSINWVTELIGNIPDIVLYIAPGFIFVNLFKWIIDSKFSSPTTQVVSGIVASFLLRSLFEVLWSPADWSLYAYVVVLCLVSGVLGGICGVVYRTPWFNGVLCWFRVYRTTTTSIWDSVVGSGAWISVHDEKKNLYYCGQYRYEYDQNGHVFLALATYYILDQNHKMIEQHMEEAGRYLVIDTSQYPLYVVSPSDPFGMSEEIK